jgi:hypothetical protein
MGWGPEIRQTLYVVHLVTLTVKRGNAQGIAQPGKLFWGGHDVAVPFTLPMGTYYATARSWICRYRDAMYLNLVVSSLQLECPVMPQGGVVYECVHPTKVCGSQKSAVTNVN